MREINKTIVDSNTSCVRAYCCDEKNEERDYEGKSLTRSEERR